MRRQSATMKSKGREKRRLAEHGQSADKMSFGVVT